MTVIDCLLRVLLQEEGYDQKNIPNASVATKKLRLDLRNVAVKPEGYWLEGYWLDVIIPTVYIWNLSI